jgi:hypothetical protein
MVNNHAVSCRQANATGWCKHIMLATPYHCGHQGTSHLLLDVPYSRARPRLRLRRHLGDFLQDVTSHSAHSPPHQRKIDARHGEGAVLQSTCRTAADLQAVPPHSPSVFAQHQMLCQNAGPGCTMSNAMPRSTLRAAVFMLAVAQQRWAVLTRIARAAGLYCGYLAAVGDGCMPR